MNAFHPEVQEFLLSLILEVVKNYDVDGIQGDDRLPALPVEEDYSHYTAELCKKEHGGLPPPRDSQDPEWIRWRAGKLTAFAETVYRNVKALKPDLLVSWAPSVYPWSLEKCLQDWPAWVNGGWADLVLPQVYRYGIDNYKRTLDSQARDSLGIRTSSCLLLPGVLMKVGAYVIAEDDLLAVITYNREREYHGGVFFFYEGLRAHDDRLAKALRSTRYATPARLPLEPAFMKHQ